MRTAAVEALSKRNCSKRDPPMPTTKAKTENTHFLSLLGRKCRFSERREGKNLREKEEQKKIEFKFKFTLSIGANEFKFKFYLQRSYLY